MILPTIHLNGSSPQRLLEGYEYARQAVAEALRKLEAVDFNGRDYYVQGATAWVQARAEHEGRCRKLKEVHDDLGQIVEHLIDEAEKREAQKI